MELDHGTCYRALRTRDARFDGRFFTGVTSTGIYCRPVCPARTPKPENCVFFACAAAAQEAGFRPCQRCRPETAPGTPAWRGTSATVARALRLIDEGALDGGDVPGLAVRLGVGERHLRRLFVEQVGAAPLAVALTRRVHLAKRLIEQTSLPMGRIALAAGFANARRFNAAVQAMFDRTPTEIRKAAGRNEAPAGGGTLELRLAARPPFDWQGLLAFMGPRAIPGVEEVAGGRYRRTIDLDGCAGQICVAVDPRNDSAVVLTVPVAAAPHLGAIIRSVRDQFDLDADPQAIAEALAEDSLLAALTAAHPGIRVPGAWDRFETAVRAILGQQITVNAATKLSGRLVERFGRPLPGSGPDAGPAMLFPRPADLVDADIAALGMPGARAETIRSLAGTVAAGEPVLETGADVAESVARLTALPGIGDWTAQYIAMRALREPDAFPAGDLVLRKALAEGGKPATATLVRNRADEWRPWRAYAAMLLWRGIPERREDDR